MSKGAKTPSTSPSVYHLPTGSSADRRREAERGRRRVPWGGEKEKGEAREGQWAGSHSYIEKLRWLDRPGIIVRVSDTVRVPGTSLSIGLRIHYPRSRAGTGVRPPIFLPIPTTPCGSVYEYKTGNTSLNQAF